ncbi:DNA polymerase III subunit gamma/tau [Psychrobacter sp. I-STPA10]|uniref:DNA polymerase III subunit gamma/tau n=1 Tax=Psychrobacter sp. I-STPA10 TaxID=2585769 RepID=UPI001E3025D7|nr:DNA polymerase III subunit gamma/tau [Psychrobacter sp. I-STPA10]
MLSQSQPQPIQPYQVLARKYRPKNFHELVGQTHVSKALINAIDHNRLHHAYLFTGTRGVGKTTIARILAKCLNCDKGVSSKPCGQCSSCVAIDDGRFIDLIEIDAASRTKVEDTRDLLDNVPYAPTQGRYKVYLIDEVHMLSTHSFNALLKTLEEPPAHVKFLLATTDPQKLPITIISRCLQFVLRPLPQQAISEHLANILSQEHVPFTEAALWQLAHAAHGSVRDALSLTDQAIAFGQGQLTDETVNDMLGLIDSADLVALLTAISVGDTQAVAAHIEQLRAQLVDAGSMFDGLAELLHQVALAQILPDISLNVSSSHAEAIYHLAEQISPDVLQLYYEITIKGRENIKLANTPLQALEMCLLRLLAFRPLATNEVNAPASIAISATDMQMTEVGDVCVDTDDVKQNIDKTEEPTIESTSIDNTSSDSSQNNNDIAAIDTIDIMATDVPVTYTNCTQNNDNTQDMIYNNITENVERLPKTTFELHEPETTLELNTLDTELTENMSQLVVTDKDPVSLIVNDDDPRQLLQSAKQVLEGEWTAQKWDYWLQYARQIKILAHDQLALARQGIMTGQILGESTLKVAFDTKHIQNTFESLAAKIKAELGTTIVRLEVDPQWIQQQQQEIPENRQKQRILMAQAAAKEGLNKSPVMQYLQTLGQPQITKLKLNLQV